jgi:hypothetical protein
MNERAAENQASRDRLAAIGRLTDDELGREVGDGWTASALVAHVGFWDRLVLGRWQRADGLGQQVPDPIEDHLADLINDAMMPEWRALPPRLALELARAAAEDVDAYIDGLDPTTVEAATAAGLPRLADRTHHRNEHVDAIERGLGG